MASGLFLNKHNRTHRVELSLHDHDDDGYAVWRVEADEDIGYFEARIDTELVTLVGLAALWLEDA